MIKRIYFSLIIGFLVGLLCKLVDFIPGNTWIGYLGIKDLLNYLGLFIIIVTFIEYTAPTVKCGIFQTLVFMLGMVFSYYATTFLAYKFISYQYALLWSIVAICSPLLCWSISQRRKEGFLSIFGTLIPILLLGNEAYKFIKVSNYFQIQLWIELVAMIIMFWKLPLNKKNRIYSIVVFVFFIPFLDYLNVIYFFARLLYMLLF